MRNKLILATSLILFAIAPSPVVCQSSRPTPPVRECRIPVGGADLYAREVGSGPPILILHGGPDFDQSYMLPEMDLLADRYHLIYYDQRGRGKSGEGVK